MNKLLFVFLFFFVLGCADNAAPDEEYTDLEYEQDEEAFDEVDEEESLGAASVMLGDTETDYAVSTCDGFIGRDITENQYSIILNIDGYENLADYDEGGSIHIEGSNAEDVFGATFTYSADSDEEGGWNTLLGRDELASMDLVLEDKPFAPVAGEPLGVRSNQSMMIRVDMSDFMISREGGKVSSPASFSYAGQCSMTIGEE